MNAWIMNVGCRESYQSRLLAVGWSHEGFAVDGVCTGSQLKLLSTWRMAERFPKNQWFIIWLTMRLISNNKLLQTLNSPNKWFMYQYSPDYRSLILRTWLSYQNQKFQDLHVRHDFAAATSVRCQEAKGWARVNTPPVAPWLFRKVF